MDYHVGSTAFYFNELDGTWHEGVVHTLHTDGTYTVSVSTLSPAKRRRTPLSLLAAELPLDGTTASGVASHPDRVLHAPIPIATRAPRDPTPVTLSSLVLFSATTTPPAPTGSTLPCYASDASLDGKIFLHQGDITRLAVDAITNAANRGLHGGGGICGAVFAAAGVRELGAACAALPRVATGRCAATDGFALHAATIIHAVGPSGDDPPLLACCYRSVLDLALRRGVRSLALPCISTGIFGFPNESACRTALKTVREWLDEPWVPVAVPTAEAAAEAVGGGESSAENRELVVEDAEAEVVEAGSLEGASSCSEKQKRELIDAIVFCVFDDRDLRLYEELLPCVFPRAIDEAQASYSAALPISPDAPLLFAPRTSLEERVIADETEQRAENALTTARARGGVRVKPTRIAAAKKAAASASDSTGSEAAALLAIGNRVRCRRRPIGALGTVSFIGAIEALPKGWWIGVTLDDPRGKNDGTVRGVELFTCAAKHGIVVRPSTLEVEEAGEEDFGRSGVVDGVNEKN